VQGYSEYSTNCVAILRRNRQAYPSLLGEESIRFRYFWYLPNQVGKSFFFGIPIKNGISLNIFSRMFTRRHSHKVEFWSSNRLILLVVRYLYQIRFYIFLQLLWLSLYYFKWGECFFCSILLESNTFCGGSFNLSVGSFLWTSRTTESNS
jgi:hypothetical protein